jgi:cupin 2 domain-containing protein
VTNVAEADLRQFLNKVSQLNTFVAMSEADPGLRRTLRDCESHHEVVNLARGLGLEIGRRWGDGPSQAGDDPQECGGDGNLLEGSCPPPGQEVVTVLASAGGWRLERIHSCEAASPAGFWYDQSEWEWVTLLRGSASLRFADEPGCRQLSRGDCLLISPGRRHRLEATDPAPGSIWLALFWQEASVA